MRPPWWRHYKINMAFHFGERLIIIVNSGGLISVTRVLMVLILVGLSRVLMVLILVGLWRAGKFWNPGAWWALSRGGIGVSPWVMTLVDLGNSANSAYLSNLQKVDQSFTAKDLGRDVIDICIGNRWYIGLTHVEFSECFFVSQHSSNVNLTQITNVLGLVPVLVAL